jgi:hypothetical protein
VTAAVAPAHARDDEASAGAAAGHGASIPWSVVALAVPAVIGAVRLVLSIRRPYEHWGDHAIFETAIRRVASGTQALGPYSRFGFHQPGPAYFEAQAPFYWLSGASPRALFLGALSINLGSALGCVLVIRRFLGETAARWAAVVLGAFLLALTPALLADPWPIYVLGLPLLLTMLLAAGATRSLAAGGGALVGASYLVQTHVATAATVVAGFAAVGAVTLAARIGRRRSDDRESPEPADRRVPRTSLLVAGAMLAVMWLPPLVQQATHDPGNLTILARFFTASHAEFDQGVDHGIRSSAGQVARQLTLMPLGRRSVAGPAGPVDVAVAAAGLLAAAGLAEVGRRRRDRFLLALGLIPLAGTLAAIWSTTRIVGEVHPYLLVWSSVLLLPAWIGLGAVLGRGFAAGSRLRFGFPVMALGLTLVAGSAGWSMLRAQSPPLRSNNDVARAGDLTGRWLAGHGVDDVRVAFSDHGEWPLAAGLIDHLDRKGLDVTVDRHYIPLFGDQFAPTGREETTLWLTPPDGPPPPGDGVQRLGEAGGSVVWAGPGPSR